MVANAFVHLPVAAGEQCTMHSCRYVTTYHGPAQVTPKRPIFCGGSGSLSNKWLPGPKWHLDRFSRFCTAHLYAQNIQRHTHRTTCNMCSTRSHLKWQFVL